jgi:uncharacterized membrane protein (UPF0182 family)
MSCLTVLDVVLDFVVDWTWFSAVGYLDVFWTIFSTKALLFLAVFAAPRSSSAGTVGLHPGLQSK